MPFSFLLTANGATCLITFMLVVLDNVISGTAPRFSEFITTMGAASSAVTLLAIGYQLTKKS